MKENKNLYEGLNGLAFWELILLVPSLLLFSYLPDGGVINIFINVILIILITMGLFTIERLLVRYFKNKR